MRATAGLGVTGPVVADLYKLLVYDPGSFFVNHRDTEKAAGMFATLIIVLPSIYTGGALLVRHRDREARLELSCPEPSQVAFAAFYADCVHEVLPITSGYRLALVYNLRRQGRGQLPEPPNYDTEQTRVAALLRSGALRKPLMTTPPKSCSIPGTCLHPSGTGLRSPERGGCRRRRRPRRGRLSSRL